MKEEEGRGKKGKVRSGKKTKTKKEILNDAPTTSTGIFYIQLSLLEVELSG